LTQCKEKTSSTTNVALNVINRRRYKVLVLPQDPPHTNYPPTMSSPSTFSSAASPTSLYIATIILYTLLILPTFYIWRRHGRPGFLAYNFIYAFCAIRITGAALSISAIHDTSLETAAAIVNSIAISPLLLAALGILHEARNARIADVDSRREWLVVGSLHGIVTTGMVLVVIGIVNVVEGVSSTADSGLIKAGLAVLVLAYVVLLAWTTISLRQPFRSKNETSKNGTVVSFHLLDRGISLLTVTVATYRLCRSAFYWHATCLRSHIILTP
jgi:hypothetical protein